MTAKERERLQKDFEMGKITLNDVREKYGLPKVEYGNARYVAEKYRDEFMKERDEKTENLREERPQ